MLRTPVKHVRNHGRFYASLAIGAAVFLLMHAAQMPLRLAAAGDAFYGAYLVAVAFYVPHGTPQLLRRRAIYEVGGKISVVLITITAVSASLTALFWLLHIPGEPDTITFVLAILSVVLGWFTLHTVAAFHYGHVYYAPVRTNGGSRDAAGLSFPETKEPIVWDFLYYSFVVGMTAQVSDVQVLTTPMRRLTVFHGIVSFFYNTVLLALGVNIIVSLTH